MLWYHDHAMAITRLNIFAGLFRLYICEMILKMRWRCPREYETSPYPVRPFLSRRWPALLSGFRQP